MLIGASDNPERYAYQAAALLMSHGHEVVLLGKKSGMVNNQPILTDRPMLEGIDTVTLYINPLHQVDWYDYIIDLKPKRVVFNPGTLNEIFELMLAEYQIEAVLGCTLVMLKVGTY